MSNVVISPNMNLPLPLPGVDPGPDYANNQNASFLTIDGHNHASGSGVQINPSGININADLPMNGNNQTLVRSVRFTSQGSVLSGASDLNCLSVVAGDLYFNDGAGDSPIQITSGGAINATGSGITGGVANVASFISNVLVVNEAASTPANVRVASVLLGNNVASSKFLTLSPPSGMASNYPLVLPSLPAATLAMTLDTSGNMGTALLTGAQIASQTVAAGNIVNATITTTQIAATTILASNIVDGTITSTQIAAGGVVASNIASVTDTVVSPLTTSSVPLFSIGSGTTPTDGTTLGSGVYNRVRGTGPGTVLIGLTSTGTAQLSSTVGSSGLNVEINGSQVAVLFVPASGSTPLQALFIVTVNSLSGFTLAIKSLTNGGTITWSNFTVSVVEL